MSRAPLPTVATHSTDPGESSREASRILEELRARRDRLPADLYSVARPDVLYGVAQRTRRLVRALVRHGLFPLAGRRILDVGCGSGGWLVDFESWGAIREDLAGIELEEERAERARRRLAPVRDERGRVLAAGADVRTGDATRLPWDDGSFDVVLQSTVFTSILDEGVRRGVATEMARVLAPGGVIVWYDFFVDNPSNPAVRGVKKREIARLFPDFELDLERATLAPPVARRLAPWTFTGALLLEKLRVLNTHYLGVLARRP